MPKLPRKTAVKQILKKKAAARKTTTITMIQRTVKKNPPVKMIAAHSA